MEKPDINALPAGERMTEQQERLFGAVGTLMARIDKADSWIIDRQAILNDEMARLRQQQERLQKAREYLMQVAWVEVGTAFLDKIDEVFQ